MSGMIKGPYSSKGCLKHPLSQPELTEGSPDIFFDGPPKPNHMPGFEISLTFYTSVYMNMRIYTCIHISQCFQCISLFVLVR